MICCEQVQTIQRPNGACRRFRYCGINRGKWVREFKVVFKLDVPDLTAPCGAPKDGLAMGMSPRRPRGPSLHDGTGVVNFTLGM